MTLCIVQCFEPVVLVYMGRQMRGIPTNSKYLHVKHICDVYGFNKIMPTFCFPFWADRSKRSAVSSPLPEYGQVGDVIWAIKPGRKPWRSICLTSVDCS